MALALLAAIGGARGGGAAPAAPRSPGDNVGWDGRFVEHGLRLDGGPVEKLVTGPDGAAYAIGTFDLIGDAMPPVTDRLLDPRRFVARWNGSDWSMIGDADRYIDDIYADSSGVYVAGPFSTINGLAAPRVARWDGSAWTGIGGGLPEGGKSLARWNGALYIGGRFGSLSSPDWNIYRWDGTAWHGMRSAGNSMSELQIIAAGPDGLYAGGRFTSFNGAPARGVARWDGAAWQGLGAGVALSVYNFAFSGQDVYVAGTSQTPGDALMRWSGGAWTSLGAELPQSVTSVAFDGADLYAVGNYATLWRRRDGVWSLQGTANAAISTLAVVDSRLTLGGAFTAIDGVDALMLARLNGGSWESWSYVGVVGNVLAFADAGAGLYAGGQFDRAGATPARNVARWDGAAWSPLGEGVEGLVYTMALSGSLLYVGGELFQAGGAEVSGIARWDGAAWSPLVGGVATEGGGLAAVAAFQVAGDDLYVGGQFDYAGGVTSHHLARWTGSAWEAVGGLPRGGGIRALAWDGANLYAAGLLHLPGSQDATILARWDGQSWTDMGAALNLVPGESINDLVWDNGFLYAGGRFADIAGVPSADIARWDGQSWLPLGRGVSPEGGDPLFSTGVDALAVSDGALYVGGYFERVVNSDGTSAAARRIARWDGQRWEGIGSGVDAQVFALAARSDGLYAGGSFAAAGGKPALGIARWTEPLRTYLPLAGR
ncbi:MAG TPA: hypothetical protein VGE07_20805 [Herpetosiphonaceae bacterium]